MLAEQNDGEKEKGFKIVEARNPLGDMTNKENVELRAQPTPISIKGNSQSGDPKKRKSVGEVESKGKLKKNKRSKNSKEAKVSYFFGTYKFVFQLYFITLRKKGKATYTAYHYGLGGTP